MSQSKILPVNLHKSSNSLDFILELLNEKFDAICFSQQSPKNLVTLAGKRWWVVSSEAEKEFNLCITGVCAKSIVIEKLKQLDAGLLIFRKQQQKYFYSVYMVENIDSLGKPADKKLTVNLDDLYSQNAIYERGIIIDNEIIGFRKLRHCRLDISA